MLSCRFGGRNALELALDRIMGATRRLRVDAVCYLVIYWCHLDVPVWASWFISFFFFGGGGQLANG